MDYSTIKHRLSCSSETCGTPTNLEFLRPKKLVISMFPNRKVKVVLSAISVPEWL